ncbi:MAG: bifunctional diaminohydroxyphosphoribosylaminopyrimidine deaminase/5-amino-6-(5-phosphoribosylamino)uracil reductase RibD [Candidatus Sericytochromatia bacterium]|nr:bifunctional diaminohydroxyphosphoribosylaminopyrimidine deaminase/5-amino-6-(5-phosphoribosylamino)uracil reductase RibD [Candidatus Tanganyikabacteria bacterium]
MPTDADLMRRALGLAGRGRGWVNPNPMVGAVVVSPAGEIVAEGYHPRVGGPHAEVVALAAAGEAARGATLYVTLEPCTHHGRTPPCTDAILRAGVSRVVYACDDENPLTAGRGKAVLEAAGIAVVTAVEEAAARELNAPFFKFVRTRMPYVLCKMAASLDGKIATASGASKWISGPEARALVQEWRATYAGVMVGIGTVLADDPGLRCQLPGAHEAARVVVDPLAATPLTARLFEGEGPVFIAVGPAASPEAIQRLRERGARIVICPKRSSAGETPGESLQTSVVSAGGVQPESPGGTGAESTGGASERSIGRKGPPLEGIDLTVLLRELSHNAVSSLLCEGGGGLNAALLRQGLIDKIAIFLAPLLLGGARAPTVVDGSDLADLSAAIRVSGLRARPIGDDILLEGEIQQA